METQPEKKRCYRPLKFKSPEELDSKIQEYYKYCDSRVLKRKFDRDGNVTEEVTAPYTLSGLAVFLDVSRDTIHEYLHNEKKPFSDIIKKAYDVIINSAEEDLLTTSTPTGRIFWLKNVDPKNFKDKQETEFTVNATLAEQLQKARKRAEIDVIESE